LTKEEHWDDRGNKWLATTHAYDTTYANRISTTDPRLNVTTIVYDSATHAQPISVTVDPLNGTGQQTSQTSYDYSTGLVLTQTDANGKTTSIDYTNQRTFAVDPFGRPGVVTGPAVSSSFFDSGGSYTTLANQQRKVVTRYFDSNALPNNGSQVEVLTDLKQQGDGALKTRTTSDQLGRPVKSETSENGSSYSISAQTVYQQSGRIMLSSNPTRNAGESTDGWTRATKDDAGRVVEVASFNGATQPPSTGANANWTGSVTTSYNANQTTVTDQASKKRRSIVDGLGRLKQVDELFENGTLYASTSYTYDSRGNLTFVNQGVQQRQFAYDSLSRLREAYHPEQVNGSGVKIATAYQYDDASNLTLKTNPNGTTVGFSYDGLNRAATKSLSTGGAWTYLYDVGTNFKGRRAS
jgi:YD repeat-containing protein